MIYYWNECDLLSTFVSLNWAAWLSTYNDHVTLDPVVAASPVSADVDVVVVVVSLTIGWTRFIVVLSMGWTAAGDGVGCDAGKGDESASLSIGWG